MRITPKITSSGLSFNQKNTRPIGPRWSRIATASALAVLLATLSGQASALALGRLNVLSALGEPLRAEIEVPEIKPDEAASLRATVAGPDAFRSAGMEYNPVLTDLQVSLQRRANGSSFLRLSTPRAITEPFVDLILEANWGAGRIVRDYTMLIDPPNLRAASSAASTESARPSAAPIEPTAPRVSSAAPRAAAASALPARRVAPEVRRAPAAKPAARQAAPAAPAPSAIKADGGNQVDVKRGDYASRIAVANKSAGVSLDQMLAAMLRANPDAFIAGNINRLKAGAVLEMPSAAQASALSRSEAARVLVASSKNFNQFRSGLAKAAPTVGTDAPDRQAAGKVQAQVDEKKPSASAPDKLALSKGSVQGKSAEDKLAQERAAKDTAAREAELNKNISDLNKLAAASAAATGNKAAAGAPAAAASGVGLEVPSVPAIAGASGAASAALNLPKAAATAATAATAASAAGSVKASASAASAPNAATATASAAAPSATTQTAASVSALATPSAQVASAPASAAVAAKPKVVAPPPPETSLLDDLLGNLWIPAGSAGLLAALGGFLWYRKKKGKKTGGDESSFLESRLQPDSFFGASGGQKVDTAETTKVSSSMVYSPSQLDAAGDVDPVAEADVYLAYGRDLQAEEILKEALRTSPSRVAVHVKLMEIYSKRRDARAFEAIANEAFTLTRAQGSEWEKVCELGRELDPGNALYQPGGKPAPHTGAAKAAATGAAAGFAVSTQTQAPAPVKPPDPEADLDLDFSLDEELVPPSKPMPLESFSQATQPIPRQSVAESATKFQDSDVSFDVETLRAIAASAASAAPAASPRASPALTPPAAAVAAPTGPDIGAIEFDMGALSLDLGGPATVQPGTQDEGGDPLQTKLDLATEFQSIGDTDGARALVQEVVAEATGTMKAKAQKILMNLG